MNTNQLAYAIHDVMTEWNESDCSDAEAIIRIQCLIAQWNMGA